MPARAKHLVISYAILLAGVAIITVWPQPEPTYEGATMHEWLRSTNAEAKTIALRILGTNNLQLLVQRFHYEDTTNCVEQFYTCLVRNNWGGRKMQELARDYTFRRYDLRDDAFRTLRELGPAAEPALPELVRVAELGSDAAATRAILVLGGIGENGWKALIDLTKGTNRYRITTSLEVLSMHPESPDVRQAVRDLTHSSDPEVRREATVIMALKPGRFNY